MPTFTGRHCLTALCWHLAAILIPLYRAICLSFLGNYAPAAGAGSFDFAYTLAQLVTTIQAGFSTYWGPYVYAHYRTEQERIGASMIC